MKISKIVATAGLMLAALGAGTSAEAQRHNGDRDHGRYEQRDDRGHHYGRNDRRRHQARKHHQRCRTVWRHHHRQRVCR
ncbi:hypothetical protein LK533_09245 [Sphingomonas sp. PL-96]|uniref:hypothetical protein n=1 Tax=Sphingomonas sp. PL-96 TaxID=2887201 RepID=UPI001E3EE0EA|nr:hypothetical protein [Sphingomonas sp. PL-96]MCC2976856.1 hypothetical protein [Sphingomonas sp. PL-96]